MSTVRTFIRLFLLVSLCFFPLRHLSAEAKCTNTGGCGYEQCCQCAALGPGIVLAGGILAFMIGVAIKASTEHSHG